MRRDFPDNECLCSFYLSQIFGMESNSKEWQKSTTIESVLKKNGSIVNF